MGGLSDPAGDIREDAFLDGRLRLCQPVTGYRAATDPVLLAAAAPVRAGQSVLDLGCGVGTAALCLAARVPGLDLHGLEVQPAYGALARTNARATGLPLTVHESDLAAMPAALKGRVFDAVIMNPPWHGPGDLGSPDPARDMANRLATGLDIWIGAGLARTRPGGWVVVIQRVERLPALLAALAPGAGDIAVLPLAARRGRDAKRVIVKARKGSRGPLRLAAPLVLHDGPAHVADQDDFTDAARAILRDGAALDF